MKKHQKHGLTDKGYNKIAWKYIGRARRKLSTKHNSTITKLQSNWLNVGHQKRHMKKIGNCPVCGAPDETQLHMYQCAHAGARRTRCHAFKQMKEYLFQNGIPTQIGNAFTNICETACNNRQMKSRYPYSPDVERAVKSQCNLPRDFILKGFLSNEWLQALTNHDKESAERSMVHLLHSVWKILFTQIWDFRNGELHGRNSIVETYEREMLKEELIEWNRNAALKIGAHQAYLAEYDIADIDKWPTSAMKNVAETLAHAARNYKRSVLARQPLITRFFSPADMRPD